jgi:CheY-like chemotaxis protein
MSDRWHWPSHVHPVLVVEDDEALRDTLIETLELAGHPVIAAANGAAALEEVRRRRPALILLDLSMPVMDGRAFITAYRQLTGPHAPVVVCTAHPDPVGQSVRLEASDYLTKPFVIRDVLAVVGAHTRALASSIRWGEEPERLAG